MIIVESGIFWDVMEDSGGGIEDPFFGFDGTFVSRLEAAYQQYCLSVKVKEGVCLYRGTDEDYVCLDDLEEAKSLGRWGDRPKRSTYGRKIRTNARYRNLINSEHSQASREFKRQVADFHRRLKKLIREYQQGKRKIAYVRRESAELFRDVYTVSWNSGRRSSGIHRLQRPQKPSKEEEKKFRDAVREELSFWQSFLDDLEKNPKWDGRRYTVEERLEMYIKTVWFIFHIGRLSGMPEGVLLHWYPTKKKIGRMCPGCAYMVEHSPFPRDVMPTVPRGGDTPCLMRCVHKVIVRYVTEKEADKRRQQLPKKEAMLRALRRFMGKKVRKYRKRSKEYNPWLGSNVWGDLR